MIRAALAVALGSALVGACTGHDGSAGSEVGPATARGTVVARVDGVPIGLDEVRELCVSTGLTPRAALARLEDERLLARAALARGYQHSRELVKESERAGVQVLLAEDVEHGNAPEEIPLAEVRARYAGVAARDKLDPAAFARYEHEVRAQLSAERHRAALDRLLARVRKTFAVQIDEAKVQALLSDPRLWGGGS
jgi:hypothetical protein